MNTLSYRKSTPVPQPQIRKSHSPPWLKRGVLWLVKDRYHPHFFMLRIAPTIHFGENSDKRITVERGSRLVITPLQVYPPCEACS